MGKNNNIKSHLSDLARMSVMQNRYTNTAFLSPEEQDAVVKTMKEEGYVNWFFYEPSGSAIRKIAVFGSEEELGYAFEAPVKVIHIEPVSEKFAEELNHRDYLGALMNLGIDRSTTGDIIIKKKEAWLFCLESISQFITENLNKVRKTSVKCSIVDDDIPQIEPDFEYIKANVAAERIDAVIASILNLSRSKAQSLIKLERVFVNESLVKSGAAVLKGGDVIVIRGFGKFIYDGIDSKTRKDRLFVSVRKYI